MPQNQTPLNVWKNSTLATAFFRGLIGHLPSDDMLLQLKSLELDPLVPWLVDYQLGPLTCREYENVWPELTGRLIVEKFSALAQNTLHFEGLSTVIEALDAADIPIVILKGCSLAEAAWGGIGMRPMKDADLWIQSADMPRAIDTLHNIDYVTSPLTSKLPLHRQEIVEGVIELGMPGRAYSMLDIHWQPTHGWWIRHCANVDFDALWARRVPVNVGGTLTHRLSNEDQLLHLATHASINAHIGSHAGLRGMLDIIFCARAWPVDWDTLIDHAETYRLKTAAWFVFNLAHDLFEWDEIAPILPRLAPSRLRQRYLNRLINREAILHGRDISPTQWRFALIFGLADRPRDVIRFLYRTVIPEKAWRDAKYGKTVRPWHHAFQMMRRSDKEIF